jgi:tetratricopeptide (TPR) repeat protein
MRQACTCLALLILPLLAAATAPPAPASTSPSLAAAWQEIAYLDYRKAAPLFAAARRTATPRTPLWAEATFGYALCLHYRQPDQADDKRQAAELYDALLATPAPEALQPLLLLLRGRLADQVDYFGDQPDPAAARACYDRLLAEHPASPLVHQAMLYRTQLAVTTMQPETIRPALAELRDWLARHPDNPCASVQWILIGRTCTYPLAQPAEAVAAYRQAEAAGLPRQVRRDSYYWRLANLAEQAGDRATAITYYRRLIVEVQRTAFAYEAQLRLRELGEEPPPLVNPFAPVEEAQP